MSKSDDKKFKETLQNLLKTPPTPHKPIVNQSGEDKKKDGRPARKSKGDRPTSKPTS